MKILVTGSKGQLGYDVVKSLEAQGIECCGADREDFDLTDRRQVFDYIRAYRPSAVVHCAAYTAVDRAEDEKQACFGVNVLGTRYIAEACGLWDAKLVYISTDYVFDGAGREPFEISHLPRPINHYGMTKYLGEQEVQKWMARYFILRVSWVFGINGSNFVTSILRLTGERSGLGVVSDQIGSPTYTLDLARLICDMVQTDKYGVYHATNEGFCSWYEFACHIMRECGLKSNLYPIKTKEYLTKASRPLNSRLSKVSLDMSGFQRLPDWRDALSRYIREMAGNYYGRKGFAG